MIEFTPREVENYYSIRVPERKTVSGKWGAPCPVHGGKDLNFGIEPQTGGAYCHSQCQRGWDILSLEQELTGADFKAAHAEVLRIVGRAAENRHARQNGANAARVQHSTIQTFDYLDEAGDLLSQTVRTETASGKRISQRRPDGNGGWTPNLEGVRRVLYNLPAVRGG